MRSVDVVSPKRDVRSASKWDGFFPYYAGYPEAFASSVLKSLDLPSGSVILDPWNGSGTTPYAASRLGYSAIGIDINPAMAVVAKARLLPSSEASALVPLGAHVLSSCEWDVPVDCDDPLSVWFGPRTAACLRGVEAGIRSHLVGCQLKTEADIKSVSCIASIFYVALFNVAKALAVRFKGSNPTWHRVPRSGETRIAASRELVEQAFQAQLLGMAEALRDSAAEPREAKVDISFGDSTRLPLGDESIDAVLTSPPYCTRIDYATTTRFELAVLHGLLPSCHVELGRKMLGSVRVPHHNITPAPTWGATCQSFLREVKAHSSKASSGYYLKTHLDYYDKLNRSLAEISRVIKKNGSAILVVQDSYYKEVHNDVPQIASEMAVSHGLRLDSRSDFSPRRSMASINKASRAYRGRSDAVEAVLRFHKD